LEQNGVKFDVMTSLPCKKDFIHHMHLSVRRHSMPTAGFTVGGEKKELPMMTKADFPHSYWLWGGFKCKSQGFAPHQHGLCVLTQTDNSKRVHRTSSCNK